MKPARGQSSPWEQGVGLCSWWGAWASWVPTLQKRRGRGEGRCGQPCSGSPTTTPEPGCGGRVGLTQHPQSRDGAHADVTPGPWLPCTRGMWGWGCCRKDRRIEMLELRCRLVCQTGKNVRRFLPALQGPSATWLCLSPIRRWSYFLETGFDWQCTEVQPLFARHPTFGFCTRVIAHSTGQLDNRQCAVLGTEAALGKWLSARAAFPTDMNHLAGAQYCSTFVHLIRATTSWEEGYCHNSHFTDQETEAQRGQATYAGPHTSEWLRQDSRWAAGLWRPRP